MIDDHPIEISLSGLGWSTPLVVPSCGSHGSLRPWRRSSPCLAPRRGAPHVGARHPAPPGSRSAPQRSGHMPGWRPATGGLSGSRPSVRGATGLSPSQKEDKAGVFVVFRLRHHLTMYSMPICIKKRQLPRQLPRKCTQKCHGSLQHLLFQLRWLVTRGGYLAATSQPFAIGPADGEETLISWCVFFFHLFERS